MPPFLHLFCFAPKRNTTLTKTFATPKSFTKGLVLLSVYIIAYFPNSHNIDFATSTDSVGWKKVPISDNVVVYLAKGVSYQSMGGNTWRTEVVSDKPSDLDLSHEFFGGAGGLATDHAINVCGGISSSTAKASLQLQNIYDGTVGSDIYWWAYIIEILS